MWRMYTLCVPLLVSKIFNKLTIVSQYKIQKHTYIYTHIRNIHINWSLCWSKNLSHHFFCIIANVALKRKFINFSIASKAENFTSEKFSSCLQFKSIEKYERSRITFVFVVESLIDLFDTNRISILKCFVLETIQKEIIR